MDFIGYSRFKNYRKLYDVILKFIFKISSNYANTNFRIDSKFFNAQKSPKFQPFY